MSHLVSHTFQAPDVAVLDGVVVPGVVEPEDAVGLGALQNVSIRSNADGARCMFKEINSAPWARALGRFYLVAFPAAEQPDAKVTGFAGRADHVL